ncbi:MAG: hypothetical protein LBH85_01610 [Treponema sp.]|nr:hypothetical protein [Treponema sp.]
MSVRDRRRISAMTPEAREKMARLEAEGKDPVTGRKMCEGVDCGCAVKHGQNEEREKTGGKK